MFFTTREIGSSGNGEENMSIGSLLKRVTNALPVILAATPGVLDAVKQVQQALKKPKKPVEGSTEAVAANGAPVRRDD
jgi:hypothetical protein